MTDQEKLEAVKRAIDEHRKAKKKERDKKRAPEEKP